MHKLIYKHLNSHYFHYRFETFERLQYEWLELTLIYWVRCRTYGKFHVPEGSQWERSLFCPMRRFPSSTHSALLLSQKLFLRFTPNILNSQRSSFVVCQKWKPLSLKNKIKKFKNLSSILSQFSDHLQVRVSHTFLPTPWATCRFWNFSKYSHFSS